MSEPERPTCATCPYFNDYRPSQAIAFCQRRPPVAFRDERGFFDSHFPGVDAYDWCGEHPEFPAYIAALMPSPQP